MAPFPYMEVLYVTCYFNNDLVMITSPLLRESSLSLYPPSSALRYRTNPETT